MDVVFRRKYFVYSETDIIYLFVFLNTVMACTLGAERLFGAQWTLLQSHPDARRSFTSKISSKQHWLGGAQGLSDLHTDPYL